MGKTDQTRILRLEEYQELDHGIPIQKWLLADIAQQSEQWRQTAKPSMPPAPKRALPKKSLR